MRRLDGQGLLPIVNVFQILPCFPFRIFISFKPVQELLQSRLRALRAIALATYQGGSGLPSNMIGVEREALIKGLLTEVFPSTYRFVGGAIIDSISPEPSGQVDIAVLLPSAPSFPMLSAADQRLVLAENVAAIIEVKSNLSAQWEQLETTVQKVKTLKKHLRDVGEGVAAVTDIPTIAVGFTGWRDVWELKKHWENTHESKRPDAAYVMEQNAFVSKTLQAEGDAALFAFIAFLSQRLEDQASIRTDLMRYAGAVARG